MQISSWSSLRMRSEVRLPERTVGVARPDGGDLGEVIARSMRSDLAGAQVHHAGRRIQGPGIGVPLIGRCREAPVGLRQALDGGNRLGAGDRARNARLVALARRLAADLPRKIERVQRLVELPALPVIAQPPAPGGDVAKVRLVPLGEAKGERLVGEGGRARLLVGVFRCFPRCRLRRPSGPRAAPEARPRCRS